MRSSYDLSSVSRVIEVGKLAWLVERLAFRLPVLRHFHANVINMAFRHTARRYAAIARRLSPDHIVGNFLICRDLIAIRPDTILNYPFVAPDATVFQAWDRAYDATEREGLFTGPDHLNWVRDELFRAGTVLCGSHYARESLEDFGVSSDRLAVVPFGYDENLFRPDQRKDIRSDQKVKVLFVGPRTYRKGADIIERIAACIDEYPRISNLTIVGRGWESRVRRFEGTKVQVHGKVSQEALAAFYRNHQFLLMPSRAEGMGLIGLEAKACGCVPIVSNRGPDEYVADKSDGIIVSDQSAEAWKSALRDCVNWKTFNRLTGPATNRARDFTWAHYAKRVSNVLKKNSGAKS